MYSQLIMLFALVFTGMGLCRAGILNKTANLAINRMVVYFAFPCMMAYKIGTMDMDPGLLKDFIVMVILSAASFVLYVLIAFLYYKARGIEDRITRPAFLSTLMPNSGFIGYPVALVFLGQTGLLLMIAHGAIVFNIFVFTYGITYLRRDKMEKTPFTPGKLLTLILKLLINPVIFSIPIGLIILFCHIPMDNVVGSYLEAISGLASPLAMIYVGSAIGESEVLSTFRDGTIWEISFVKLIVIPFITALCVMWLPVSPVVKATLILAASFPCAAIPVMLGQQEGLDYAQAGRALLLSTMISVVTTPLVVKILTILLPLGV